MRGKVGHGVILGYNKRGPEKRIVPLGLVLFDLPADMISQEDVKGVLFHAVTMATVTKLVEHQKGEHIVRIQT